MRFIVLSVLCLGAVAACGGDGGGSDSAPNEAGLRDALTKYAVAIRDGKGLQSYSYLHQDYKAKCEQDDWLGVILLLRGFYPEIEDAEFRISSVDVVGDRGEVSADYYVDDRPLGFDAEGDDAPYWIFDDGKWWVMTDEAAPCDTAGGGTTLEETVEEAARDAAAEHGYAGACGYDYDFTQDGWSADIVVQMVDDLGMRPEAVAVGTVGTSGDGGSYVSFYDPDFNGEGSPGLRAVRAR